MDLGLIPLEWLVSLTQWFANLGNNGFTIESYISGGNSNLAAFASAYLICDNIAKTICQPFAYTLLVIFGMLDLYEVVMQLHQQGGGGTTAPTSAIKAVIKFAFTKWLIDNSHKILSGIWEFCLSITKAIDGSLGSLNTAAQNIYDQAAASDLNLQENLTLVVIGALGLIATIAAFAAVLYVILSRYFQAYLYLAFAPIPMATFAYQHTMQMGMGFFRGFTSVALQATIISLALEMFPAFTDAIQFEAGNLIMALCSYLIELIILIGMVLGSSSLAKSLLGAG